MTEPFPLENTTVLSFFVITLCVLCYYVVRTQD